MKKVKYSDVFSKEKYKLIVLDMDGTLYYQRSMQFFMCMEMGIFGIRHPFSLGKLQIIGIFRKIREQSEYSMMPDFEMVEKEGKSIKGLLEYQYEVTAKKMNKTVEEVRQTVEEWMFKRPLKYIDKLRDRKLCEWIVRWTAMGKKVVVFSDYPVEKKLAAMGIVADAAYCSDEARIGQMKPSKKGMEIICEDFGVVPEQILVVGDRMSKDGRMAENAGADFVILKKWKWSRIRNY